ncbi:hypothetical protein [Leptothrix discophora]|uniref:Uncharacterized protein n=1 Tax=Leptothrix discophora TaxID=89 RepID=A0ABT9G3N5_LEPDI|nr:hypothetical protein [Leptothrix discophora]MDP4301104.1 hypothetical protein [Leptothrix discophora]
MKIIDIVCAIVLVSMSGALVGVDARDIVRQVAAIAPVTPST